MPSRQPPSEPPSTWPSQWDTAELPPCCPADCGECLKMSQGNDFYDISDIEGRPE